MNADHAAMVLIHPRICLECQRPTNRSGTAKYCGPCAIHRRKLSIERSRARLKAKKERKALIYYCRECGATKINNHSHYCDSCNERKQRIWRSHGIYTGQRNAHNMVALAKKAGLLPELDGAISCVDCDAPATDYEHRDYNYPLFVSPVCRRCNIKRSKALPINSAHDYLAKK